MSRLLQSLTARLRRAPGPVAVDAALLRGELNGQSGAALLRRKRTKVAVFAVIFGFIAAAINLPGPAEDFYRALRAEIRSRPAPQDIAMIAIDDKTMNALQRTYPTRFEDSRLLDKLVASGVKRIIFDRAHGAPQTAEADALFASTLARHSGKIWLGFAPRYQRGMQAYDEILPLPAFRRHAPLAAMTAQTSAFDLAVLVPTRVELNGVSKPSLSAVLADFRGPERNFRPDLAFDPSTVPTFSYIDVIQGRVSVQRLAGKSVVVGDAFLESPDYFRMPLRDGRVPGAYMHIVAAHTLKRGIPVDSMFVPALLAAALVMAAYIMGRTRSVRTLGFVAVALLAAPFVLDEFGVNMDVMSALLALLVAGIGFARINRKYYSTEVDAMTTAAISSDKPSEEHDVYALKIANLAEMSEGWSEREIGEFVNALITYVKGPGEVGDVAFERDMLVWMAPRLASASLERHADGLALMLKTAISHDWQSASSAPALGIDTNHELPLDQRIRKAMQTAEEAASRGARFIINDAAQLEARNLRIGLLRVLEKGLRERSIAVAYQPKVDLATGRIVGAETLIRWRPDGGDLVNPQELVLAAEAGDLINELTLVVMEAALHDAKQAIALDPGFKLAVNMSAKSLSDTHLLFELMTMLGRHGFPPENLTLELTETAKLEDKRIAPQLAALKARGIGLSIDDFGTGQSNLEYIEKLPSTELKIDKRFVQHMATSEESRAVVRATIEIAHSLGKVVVAEGVEDQSVAAALRAMGCDQGQGYLFSRAIPMRELLRLMGGGRIVVNS
ncbi:EAL domain-containing protein [Porphyrobacter sp. LM 6]|uniref:EAL domain-containing protein n=1 Tax=Porphyrobacter sp. LM 6 TaxID=1896196 RepID=UPI0008639CBD|nr:EAL domain-containing protein [Porphyrobacter sp. LM 6]AOL94682.1 EAL domain, c-di-GMP-specific phosphodiesterase class I (or its enzymatically inactive variant) [Porphyrobacter sp. LM 6]